MADARPHQLILDNLIAEKKAVPMIVVMEDGGITPGVGGQRGGAQRGAAPAGPRTGGAPAAVPAPAGPPTVGRRPAALLAAEAEAADWRRCRL